MESRDSFAGGHPGDKFQDVQDAKELWFAQWNDDGVLNDVFPRQDVENSAISSFHQPTAKTGYMVKLMIDFHEQGWSGREARDTLFKCQDDDEDSPHSAPTRSTSKTRPSWPQMTASVVKLTAFSRSLRSLVTETRGASEADHSASSGSVMSLSGASHSMWSR